MVTTALIMAGGRGERFWPKSRKGIPKQFLCLTNSERTMIQSTVDRILPLVNIKDIYISTNKDYKALVMEQLPDLPEENILCEPVGKNTAPCIGWGAVVIREKYGDANMLVLPSDHLIMQPQIFRNVLKNAISVADTTDALVTLGISPTSPDTGYGYIQYDDDNPSENGYAFSVKRFVEKPDLETAKGYLDSGDYLWNSGMFIWKVSAILREIETHLPDHYALLTQIEQSIGQPDAEVVLNSAFNAIRPISIDYGVMEKASRIYILPASFGWDDVGSWLAVGRVNSTNEQGNVIKGDVVAINTSHCIIQGNDKLIATVGLDNLIVVDTKDALLVCAKDNAGEIKKILENLRASERNELL